MAVDLAQRTVGCSVEKTVSMMVVWKGVQKVGRLDEKRVARWALMKAACSVEKTAACSVEKMAAC